MDLKASIKGHGFTISEIAKALNITQSALSQQINNSTITFAKVEQIAGIMGVSVIELINDKQPEPATPTFTCPHCGKPLNIHID